MVEVTDFRGADPSSLARSAFSGSNPEIGWENGSGRSISRALQGYVLPAANWMEVAINPEHRAHSKHSDTRRNPFGVMDVPDPHDDDVTKFAVTADLKGSGDDVNAKEWSTDANADAIEGLWRSRWNGGADPTIPDDAPDKWKAGVAEIKTGGDRVYLFFTWDNGARRGLIDAQRQGPNRLIGKYINLTDPKITRPWSGRVVDARRIDGCWTAGRLDFRR